MSQKSEEFLDLPKKQKNIWYKKNKIFIITIYTY